MKVNLDERNKAEIQFLRNISSIPYSFIYKSTKFSLQSVNQNYFLYIVILAKFLVIIFEPI
jgi:hypothetical protein